MKESKKYVEFSFSKIEGVGVGVKQIPWSASA